MDTKVLMYSSFEYEMAAPSSTDVNFYSGKDVAADNLKAIRRKPVPADNLKQSVANPLLLKIKPVSS
ncbi:hypothetical protein L1987_43432 [Smallanthus sonchifolius]|uniref:Uncharacterized protein n=1 Tax=Smallanthus sonchifolius TaxID=185202 RepID=A0ACB9GLG6_9ASTR|nr:hypothetical protein L1987_43432 [Smallanthus sonchifolius]